MWICKDDDQIVNIGETDRISVDRRIEYNLLPNGAREVARNAAGYPIPTSTFVVAYNRAGGQVEIAEIAPGPDHDSELARCMDFIRSNIGSKAGLCDLREFQGERSEQAA